MNIINIDTGKVIEVIGKSKGHYWTTPKHWVEFKEWCRFMEQLYNKHLYGNVRT